MGDKISTPGNKGVKNNIKFVMHNEKYFQDFLNSVINEHASMPIGKSVTTYRWQGMTRQEMNNLIAVFNADKKNQKKTIYKITQFFSTSKSKDEANVCADNSKDKVKVLFKITGKSGRVVSVPNDLKLNNNKREILYRPLTPFLLKDIKQIAENSYEGELKEVAEVDRAPYLPY